MTTQSNPWTRSAWNITEQGRITRSTPELAKRLQAEAPKVDAAAEAATVDGAWRALRQAYGAAPVEAAKRALEQAVAANRQQ